MMVKISKFPKIGQFRQVVKEIGVRSAYVGQDKDDNPIYDGTLPKPILTFKGTVKLHGTNAGVGHNFEDGIWVQSRTNIITPEHDNYGFAFFVESRKEVFQDLINQIRDTNKDVIGPTDGVIIFGEWAGNGIQKGVAISGIDKSFFIFDVKVLPENGDENYYLESHYLSDNENNIYNIEDFLSYSIKIDFNDPQAIQNELGIITQEIEKLCPVGKSFDVEGIGEGVVWSTHWDGIKYRFKVKGEKHSTSKVKTLAKVDTEKMANINEFIDYAVTENRFNQSLENIFPNNGDLDIKKLGDVIRWVIKDITEEEIDVMVENSLEPKDVNKYISNKVRNLFLIKYNKLN